MNENIVAGFLLVVGAAFVCTCLWRAVDFITRENNVMDVVKLAESLSGAGEYIRVEHKGSVVSFTKKGVKEKN